MASRAQGQRTRDRIVRAAMQAFVERGYQSTSLDAVAGAVGVTKQGLLHWFPSKGHLLVAVLEQIDLDERAAAAQVSDRTLDLVEIWTALVRRTREQPDAARLLATSAAESTRSDHPAHAYFQHRYARIRAEIAAGIEDLQEAGRVTRAADAGALAGALLALVGGLNVHQLIDPAFDAADAMAAVVRLLDAGS